MKLLNHLYNFFFPPVEFEKISKTEDDRFSLLDNSDDSIPSSEVFENSESEQPTPTEKEIQDFVNAEIERRVLKKIASSKEDESMKGVDLIDFDPLFDEAARLIVFHQMGSTSLIQRRLKLGYNRAGRIVDQLEFAKIIGPFEGSAARKVLVNSALDLERFLRTKSSSLHTQIYLERRFIDILNKHEIYISEKVTKILEEREIERIKNQILEKDKLIKEKEKRKELEKKAKKELIEESKLTESGINEMRRGSIPQEVLDIVWRRDQGKCVKCESQELIEFDHIIPFSKGGSNTPRNLQILCQKCNREKSNKIGLEG